MSAETPLARHWNGFAARRPGVVGVACGGAVAFVAYFAVFLVTRPGDSVWLNFSAAVMNAASAAILAGGVVAVIQSRLIGRSIKIQAPAHTALAIGFSYVWYVLVIVLRGLRGGSIFEGFAVNPFVSVTLTWQLFQGLALYAVAALGAYVLHYRAALKASEAHVVSAPAPAALRHVMVRGADGLISLDLDEVLYLRAADDGACIVTRTGAHETRKTLTALVDLLPEGRFVRAHRSVLVNREAILAAEPAGDGRLVLHLPAGESIKTSRAGARAVRESAI